MVAVIPARYSSVRLPGKLMLPIDGRELILHTLDRAREARSVDRVIVATDDKRIFDLVDRDGGDAVMTSETHQSGTDRVAEVAEQIPDASIFVNVQGDEPLISPETIDAAVEALAADERADMSTTYEPIQGLHELLNFNLVKVVAGDNGYALYFSRSPMPFPRDAALKHGGDPNRAIVEEPGVMSIFRKHTGLYAYRREYLLRLSKLPPTRLEETERLEQLRALEDGAKIKIVQSVGSSIGVDTQEDYEAVSRIVEGLKVAIRPATSDDVPQIARVHVESWQRSFTGIAPEEYLNSMSVEKREKVFADRLTDRSYRLLVADHPQQGVIGFIDFGRPDFENYGFDARVYSFYLLPEFQRAGVGVRLFERSFERMAEEGFRSMCLDTLEMSPYRRFYDKRGGKIVARDRHKLGETEYPTVIYAWEDLRL